jgi:hypothetical protein
MLLLFAPCFLFMIIQTAAKQRGHFFNALAVIEGCGASAGLYE